MNNDFFSRLELELGSLTREGMHLADSAARGRRRAIAITRRGLAIATLALALGVSLDSEFPATARGGQATTTPATMSQGT